MTTQKIIAKEALIKTATVEVKILTIGGKQVTLAVFRQLPREHVIDPETWEFRGLPWGRVHYFWGECADKEETGHLHIVWQKGNELRRACVEENPSSDPEINYTISNLKDYRRLITKLGFLLAGRKEKPSRHGDGENSSVKASTWQIPGDDKDVRLLQDIWMDGEAWEGIRKDAEEKIEERIKILFGRLNPNIRQTMTYPPSDQQLLDAKAAVENRINEMGHKWQDHYNELSTLDQLFIAV